MSIDQEVEILRSIPLFSSIEPSKLKLLCFASERLTFKEGQSLFRQGDVADSAYIIVCGTADVVLETPNGSVTVASVGENDIVGEIAILCDVPRTATITATSELSALRITKQLFFRMVSDFPDIAVNVMRVLAHRLEQTTVQLTEAKALHKNLDDE